MMMIMMMMSSRSLAPTAAAAAKAVATVHTASSSSASSASSLNGIRRRHGGSCCCPSPNTPLPACLSLCLPACLRVRPSVCGCTIHVLFIALLLVCPLACPLACRYCVVQQLVSRCQHEMLGERVIQRLLARLLRRFPLHMFWHLQPMVCSGRTGRKAVAHAVLREAMKGLQNDTKETLVNLYQRYKTLFEILIEMATDTGERTNRRIVAIDEAYPDLRGVFRQDSHAFLMPVLAQLDVPMPATQSAGSARDANWSFDSFTQVRIHGVKDSIEVMRWNQRPTKLSLIGSDGKEYTWLVKAEQNMMEVGGYVNRFLERDPEARMRNLKVRTFSVVPLNEVSGFIEWVSGLQTLRQVIVERWQHMHGANYRSLVAEVRTYMSE
eukprot:GHVU01178292.1.p1 GENE.GHVU01178292.1~~GHVU01178292.1.p1  ORF type:complete len:381 (+),score=67.42 GHVU01178292.1:49-1191(+)